MDNQKYTSGAIAELSLLVIRQHDCLFKPEEPNSYRKETSKTPAIDFEEKHGLTGIGARYNMPGDRSRAEWDINLVNTYGPPLFGLRIKEERPHFDAYIQEKIDDLVQDAEQKYPQLNKLFDQFTEANPELNDLKLDRGSYKQVYGALTGVVSGYNIDDINHFTETQKQEDAEDSNWSESELQLSEQVMEKYSFPNWRASPKTIQSILQQEPNTQAAEKQESAPKNPKNKLSRWARYLNGGR